MRWAGSGEGSSSGLQLEGDAAEAAIAAVVFAGIEHLILVCAGRDQAQRSARLLQPCKCRTGELNLPAAFPVNAICRGAVADGLALEHRIIDGDVRSIGQ